MRGETSAVGGETSAPMRVSRAPATGFPVGVSRAPATGAPVGSADPAVGKPKFRAVSPRTLCGSPTYILKIKYDSYMKKLKHYYLSLVKRR